MICVWRQFAGAGSVTSLSGHPFDHGDAENDNMQPAHPIGKSSGSGFVLGRDDRHTSRVDKKIGAATGCLVS